MSLTSFQVLPNTSLGIDIGTASIKAVELSLWGDRVSLKNYGEAEAAILYDKPFRSFEKNSLVLSGSDIAKALRAIIQEAKIQTQKAVFSIPDFSSFFTTFELPPMSKDELPSAIQFEARRHVPVPLGEVTFDWQLLGKRFDEKTASRILLVAVPNETINQYQQIAQLANLNLAALEVEVFALLRAALRGLKIPCILVDVGAQTTTITVAHEGILRNSRSVDIGGNGFTNQIARALSLDYKAAEEEKKKTGLLPSSHTRKVLSPLVDVLMSEIGRTRQTMFATEKVDAQKIIIGGGSGDLPGLVEYVQEQTKKETEVVDPFRNIFYPPILEKTLKSLGSSYAVAVGVALRGLE